MWVVAVVVLLVVIPWSLKGMRPTPPTSAARPPRRLTSSETAEIDALLAQDQQIAAIKRLRELQSLGLKEAKEAIDAWQPGTSPTPSPSGPALTADARAELDHLVTADQQIAAIKRYRELTGCGLREAKDAITSWQA